MIFRLCYGCKTSTPATPCPFPVLNESPCTDHSSRRSLPSKVSDRPKFRILKLLGHDTTSRTLWVSGSSISEEGLRFVVGPPTLCGWDLHFYFPVPFPESRLSVVVPEVGLYRP